MRLTARLLLPGRSPDGGLWPWNSIAAQTGFPTPVDGYTDWSQLVELRPGIDASSIPVAAAGYLDPVTRSRLLQVFSSSPDSEWVWLPDIPWLDALQTTDASRLSQRSEVGAFRDLAASWAHRRFSGRAQCETSLIEAPPYADSLLVTTTDDVFHRMVSAGLEIHEVTRARHIPIWCD